MTPDSLLEQVITDYCAAVARENKSTNESKIAAWMSELTDAQKAAFLAKRAAIEAVVSQ